MLLSATLEIRVFTNGPLARISRMSAMVVAGAVDAAMAPSRQVVGQSMPKRRAAAITMKKAQPVSQREMEMIRRRELCMRR